MKSITEAAREIGLPERTLYAYVAEGFAPHCHVHTERLAMTAAQVQRVRDVLETHGRKGLREGRALHTSDAFPSAR